MPGKPLPGISHPPHVPTRTWRSLEAWRKTTPASSKRYLAVTRQSLSEVERQEVGNVDKREEADRRAKTSVQILSSALRIVYGNNAVKYQEQIESVVARVTKTRSWSMADTRITYGETNARGWHDQAGDQLEEYGWKKHLWCNDGWRGCSQK